LSKRAIAIIIAGFFTVLVAFAIRYAYGLLLPHMLPSLGISKTEAGIIFSSYFIAYTLFELLGLPFSLAFIVTVLVMFGVGMATEKMIVGPLLRRGSRTIHIVLATIGLSIFLRNFAMLAWGTDVYRFRAVLETTDSFETPAIEELVAEIKLPTRTESDNDIQSGAGAKAITFTTPFKTLLAVSISVGDMQFLQP